MSHESDPTAIEVWKPSDSARPVIRKVDMIPMLLAACPGFQPMWDEHVAYWHGEPAGVYNDLGEFAGYLVGAFRNGQIECVRAAFDTLEQFLIDGDAETKEYAVVGFIEDVQNQSSSQAVQFIPFLKPQSLLAWKEVDEWWKSCPGGTASQAPERLTGGDVGDGDFGDKGL